MDPNQGQQTPAPAPATDTTDQEWEQAGQDFISEHAPAKPEEKKAEQTPSEQKPAEKDGENEQKPAEGAEKTTETQTDTDDKKSDEEQGAGDDSKKKDESAEPDDSAATREARATQREIEADQRAMQEDIRKEMFSDMPTELKDADGDPIRTVEDVQRLINPSTKKPFTKEEATAWLLTAQQHLEKEIGKTDKQIEQIAEVNITIRDEADNIRTKYKELLGEVPGLFKKVWGEYQKTLTTDEKSGIITKAPVSLEQFFDVALAPYAERAEELAKQDENDSKKAQETRKNNDQSDRTDITSGGKSDTMDPEEKEWAEAGKKYYEEGGL